jgi:enoyl-CoA hydratase/carnithine racemase
MTGRIIGAQEALEMGIVNRVVSDADLDAEVEALAEKFASGPPMAYRFTKLALNSALDKDVDTEFDFEQLVALNCILGEEFREGTQAFREKRPPSFPGRHVSR